MKEQIEQRLNEWIDFWLADYTSDILNSDRCGGLLHLPDNHRKLAIKELTAHLTEVYYLKADGKLPENPYIDYAEKGKYEFLELQRCRIYSKAQGDILTPDSEGRVWASVYKEW